MSVGCGVIKRVWRPTVFSWALFCCSAVLSGGVQRCRRFARCTERRAHDPLPVPGATYGEPEAVQVANHDPPGWHLNNVRAGAKNAALAGGAPWTPLRRLKSARPR